jgi:serine/threonine protein kinase
MLVYSRDPLYIKLTNFSLFRISKDLTTYYGTVLYLALEVYKSEKYTLVIDIWSLDIVVY